MLFEDFIDHFCCSVIVKMVYGIIPVTCPRVPVKLKKIRRAPKSRCFAVKNYLNITVSNAIHLLLCSATSILPR